MNAMYRPIIVRRLSQARFILGCAPYPADANCRDRILNWHGPWAYVSAPLPDASKILIWLSDRATLSSMISWKKWDLMLLTAGM